MPNTNPVLEMPKPDDDLIMLGIQQSATLLGVSRRTMYRLLDAGTVKSGYIGRRRVIPRAALLAYAASLPETRTA